MRQSDGIPTKKEMEEALTSRCGKEIQKKIANTTVAICGLGGLGSNIAISLARAGVGKLILIDFDQVDITNLHRQQYLPTQIGRNKSDALRDTLQKISPYIEIEAHCKKVTEDNVERLTGQADIICEAFDDAEQKAMFVNAVLEKTPDKYLVSASGMAGIGSPNEIKTKKISSHFYICGDGVSDVNDDIGLLATRVMLCAAHQAHTVIRIILEKFDV